MRLKKIIIISSVKSKREFPASMKVVKATKSYKILPVKWINDLESLISFVFGPRVKRKVDLYRKYLSVRDEKYLNWAVKELMEWGQDKPLENIIHIHGSRDMIFPTLYINNYVEVPDGDHSMILKKADWISEFLEKNLN